MRRLSRLVTAAALVLASIAPASALTSTTITIDGDLSDWAGVRADPDNTSRDTQISDPDPDYPGQPDRDCFIVNATWDEDFLYLAFRRTAGGTKAIAFGAYIDLDGDGLLQNSDVVAWWKVGQSTASRYADAHAPSPTAGLLRYNQAVVGQGGPLLHPGGDPMGHDGETPDGWADVQSGSIQPIGPMDGWMAENGIEFEGRIAWSDLGVAPGSPISIHFCNGNGESFGVKWKPSDTYKWTGNPPHLVEENRGQVEDNIDDIFWLLAKGVDVSPDNAGGGAAGETVVYTHTVTNSGNATDTFDLSAVSSRSWDTSVTDAGGTAVSSVTLGPDASMTLQVHVTIPSGTADGTTDVTTLQAVSRSDPATSDGATDTTRAGRLTVMPDQAGSMAPGQTIEYAFTVSNNLPSAAVLDLTTVSSLGFPTLITDRDGTTISSVGLASGESTQVCVLVSVPASATVGAQDVTTLAAAVMGSPSVRASATASTLVLDGLRLQPDNVGYGGANSSMLYPHTVANSWPSTRTISLSAVSSQGWAVQFLAEDGVTPISAVTLGPNGASADVYVRVTIPGGTAEGTVDVITARAETGSQWATATDTTTVRRLATYATSGYQLYQDDFDVTDTIWARATGLAPGDKVYFVWKDPSGNVVRTSPLRTVDTMGHAFDEYVSLLTDPVGGWILELYDDRDVLFETAAFTLSFDAEITAVYATDAPGAGTDIVVSASVDNHVARDIVDSTVTYVIWWDTDANGTFGSGDTYIDASGAPQVWDGVSSVGTHVTSDVDVAGNGSWTDIAWTVNNRLFPNQGTYNVTATWRDSSGLLVIDERTTQFYSIPTLGWPLSLAILLFVATVASIPLVRLRRGGAA